MSGSEGEGPGARGEVSLELRCTYNECLLRVPPLWSTQNLRYLAVLFGIESKMSVTSMDSREDIIEAAEEAGLEDAREILKHSETGSMTQSEKLKVYDAYDEGQLSRPAAVALLGDSITTLEENASGTSTLLQGDHSRFLAD